MNQTQKQNLLDQTLGRALQWISWDWQRDAYSKYRQMVIARHERMVKLKTAGK